uniref:Uncharacterized protein n=1 Tax=Pararge aegeria TaxID=116150 RepID=S4PT87_9NEOP
MICIKVQICLRYLTRGSSQNVCETRFRTAGFATLNRAQSGPFYFEEIQSLILTTSSLASVQVLCLWFFITFYRTQYQTNNVSTQVLIQK